MHVQTAQQNWQKHGFVVLPGYLTATDLAAASAERDVVFPSPTDSMARRTHDGSAISATSSNASLPSRSSARNCACLRYIRV